jgi:hypothetical protein
MSGKSLSEKIVAIRKANPQNRMARHFDAAYFEALDPEGQARMARIVATGVANTASSMGAYAMDPSDYEDFAPFFDAVIRDFHGIEGEISQPHDWDVSAFSCDLGAIDEKLKEVSMRVRVARNASTYPLPGAMTREERVAFENEAVKAFQKLIDHPDYGGQYLSITPGSAHEIDSAEYDRRVAAHQMFKDMSGDRFLNVAGISSDWPYGRGMYVS